MDVIAAYSKAVDNPGQPVLRGGPDIVPQMATQSRSFTRCLPMNDALGDVTVSSMTSDSHKTVEQMTYRAPFVVRWEFKLRSIDDIPTK